MNFLGRAWSFITTAANWLGPQGLAVRLGEHLWYSLLGVALAALIGIPLGLWLGHRRHYPWSVVLTSLLRSLPALGLLTLLVLGMGFGLLPVLIALALQAIPAVITSTYAGVRGVPSEAVDGARTSGMTEGQVLARAELPNALPRILRGVRNSLRKVIATVAVAAYVGWGGLGRYLVDGLRDHDYVLVLVGALSVAALALAVDWLMAAVIWLAAPATGRLDWLTGTEKPKAPRLQAGTSGRRSQALSR